MNVQVDWPSVGGVLNEITLRRTLCRPANASDAREREKSKHDED
jgi:hypothetical protein